MKRWCLGGLLLAAAALRLALPPSVPGEEPAAPLLFRREFVPASLLEREARGLIPVRREEFATLLAAVEQQATSSVPSVWIARTSASWELHEQTLVGKVQLHLRTQSSTPQLFSLGSLPGSVSEPRWRSNRTDRVIWGRVADGDLLVQVERADVLEFEWSVPGRRDPWGALSYEFVPPDAPRHEWTFTIPPQVMLAATAGSLTARPAAGTANRWNWQGAGAQRTRFRLVPDAAEQEESTVLVHSNVVCTAEESSLEVRAQLKLDVYREPLKRLEMMLLGDWQPRSVRLAGQKIPFRVTGKAGQERLQLDFESPLLGPNRLLVVEGRGTWQENVPRSAPTVQVQPGDWMEGTWRLDTPPELEARDWQPTEARWLPPEPAPSAAAAEAISSALWTFPSSASSVQFSLRRRALPTHVAQGTTLAFEPQRIIAKQLADLTADRRGAFTWTATVQPGWLIDDLVTVPDQLLEHWEVVPRGPGSGIRLTLRHSPQAEQPVRVLLTASRDLPSAGIAGTSLQVLKWDATTTEGLTAVVANAGTQWRVQNEALAHALSLSELTAAELGRLNLTANEDRPLLVRDPQLAPLKWLPAETLPRYRAEVSTELAWSEPEVLATLRARIVPEEGEIRRVRLRVRPSLGDDVPWLFAERQTTVAARRVRSAADGSEDEWELELPRATSGAVTFVTTRRLADSEFQVPLLTCLLSESQGGQVQLRCREGTRPVVVEVSGFQARYAAAAAETEVWQYDPLQPTTLRLRRASGSELASLQRVESCELSTVVRGDHLWHTATLVVSAPVASRLQLTLPPGCRWSETELNGEPVRDGVRLSGQTRQIRLGPNSQHHLRISYDTPLSRSLPIWSLAPAWPELVVPVHSRCWELVLPHRWQACLASPPTPSESWEQWLRGLLFQPLWNHTPEQQRTRHATALVASTTWRFAAADRVPQRVWICSTNSLQASSWIAFTLLAASLVLARRRSTRATIVVFTLAGGLWLFTPTFLAPLSIRCLAGMCLGMLLPLATSPGAACFAGSTPRANWFRAARSWWFIVLLALIWIGQSLAQDSPMLAKISRVLLPVDEKQQPLGDYVYMPESLFTRLHTAQQQRQAGPEVLFGPAHYHLRAAEEAPHALETCDARLQVEVLQAPGTIAIDAQREGMHVREDSVRVDDRAVAWEWNDAGTALLVEIASPGSHEVAFTLQRKTQGAEAKPQWRFLMPPGTRSTLEVDSLLNNQLDIQPRLTRLATNPSLAAQFDLGRNRELRVSLLDAGAGESAREVRQLLWCQVWPGGNVVEARWSVQQATASREPHEIVCPAEYRLLSAAANVPVEVTWERTDAAGKLRWVPDTAGQSFEVVALLFAPRQPDSPWSFPRFEPRGAALVQHWGALNLASSSRLAVTSVTGPGWLEPAAFAAVWGAADAPQFALDLSEEPPPWQVPAVAEPLIRNTPTVAWNVLHDHVDWQYEVALEPAADGCQLLVHLGEESIPLQALWQQDATTRSVAWLPLPQGKALVGLTGPGVQRGRLRLSGRLPASAGRTLMPSLPAIVTSAPPTATRVAWWRSPLVEVHVEGIAESASHPLVPFEPGALQGVEERLVKPDDPLPRWTVHPYRPVWEAQWRTSLEQADATWLCRFTGTLAVSQPPLRSLTLQWPADWLPPEVSEGDVSLSPLAENGTIQLTFRNPYDPRPTFTLVSRPVSPRSWNRSVPVVVPPGNATANHQLEVPAAENYRWLTRGVHELPGDTSTSATRQRFEVTHANYEVKLVEQAPSQAVPKVVLAEHEPLASDGTWWQTTWWLSPAGSESCPLHWPPGVSGVSVCVDGQATLVDALGQIPLRSSQQPQCVQILYRGAADSATVPLPGSWTIEHEQWPAVDPVAARSLRCEAIATLVEQGLALGSSESASLRAWSTWWHATLAAEVSTLLAHAPVGEVPHHLREPLQSLRALSPLVEPFTVVDAELTSPADRPLELAAMNAVPTAYSSRGVLLVLKLLAACVWCAVVTAVAWLAQLRSVTEWSQRNETLLRTLAGLLLMILFQPFWLGTFLALVAASQAVVWPWQSQAAPTRRGAAWA